MLTQQFIVDYLNARTLSVPDFLRDDSLVDLIEAKGFELFGDHDFPGTVAAINTRYPYRQVVPLAGRGANDDIIALLYQPTDLGQIIFFHGWTDPGFEGPLYFATFNDWLAWHDPWDEA
jgi:hypothetical protein